MSALDILEVVQIIINFVEEPPDLLNCACVNRSWNDLALKKLYEGSKFDMKLRTPDIRFLNCLFVASRERFARNMSFVKHLCLYSEANGVNVGDEIYGDGLCCLEVCRPLIKREDSELLLQAGVVSPVSIAIPLELINNNLGDVFDLVLHEKLESLTIDGNYCRLLATTLRVRRQRQRDPIFRSLKALSIHLSSSQVFVSALCDVLRLCDLTVFHLQDTGQLLSIISTAAVRKLLTTLRAHRGLEALAIMAASYSISLESFILDAESGVSHVPWPALQGLYLHIAGDNLSQALPKYKQLCILVLRSDDFETPGGVESTMRGIARCAQLEVIDIRLKSIPTPEQILDVARGCGSLRRLIVRDGGAAGPQAYNEITGEYFSNLLKALSKIELLLLDFQLRMGLSELQTLALCCCRLQFLHFDGAQLYVSSEELADVSPIPELELLTLGHIDIADALNLIESNGARRVAAEWRRVFPRLRESPGANLGEHLQQHYLDSDDNSISSVDEELEAQMAASATVRGLLWEELGYEMNPTKFPKHMRMGQARLEVEKFGWPVVPHTAYGDIDNFSTSARRRV